MGYLAAPSVPRAALRYRALLFCVVLGSTACPRSETALTPASTLDGQTSLGWQLDPGQTLQYDITLRRGEVDTLARWTYEVVSSDDRDSVVTASSSGGQPTTLTVRTDGRITGGDSDFASQMLQRTVWVSLPRRPVRVGDMWDDPQLVRPFLDLLPVGTADRVLSESRVVALSQRSGEVTAIVDSEVSVRLSGRVILEVTGRASFNASSGLLNHRELTARFHGSQHADTLYIAAQLHGGLGRASGGRQ